VEIITSCLGISSLGRFLEASEDFADLLERPGHARTTGNCFGAQEIVTFSYASDAETHVGPGSGILHCRLRRALSVGPRRSFSSRSSSVRVDCTDGRPQRACGTLPRSGCPYGRAFGRGELKDLLPLQLLWGSIRHGLLWRGLGARSVSRSVCRNFNLAVHLTHVALAGHSSRSPAETSQIFGLKRIRHNALR